MVASPAVHAHRCLLETNSRECRTLDGGQDHHPDEEKPSVRGLIHSLLAAVGAVLAQRRHVDSGTGCEVSEQRMAMCDGDC